MCHLGGALAGICLFAIGHSAATLVQDQLPMFLPYVAAVDLLPYGLAVVGASGSLVSIRRYLRAA